MKTLKKISYVIGLILFLPIVGISTLQLLGDGKAKMIERPKIDRDNNNADTEKFLALLKQEILEARAQGKDKKIVSEMEELIESMEHYINSTNLLKPE
jgi:hypothetical protein